MPITYRVDHGLKVVFAAGTGKLTDADVFGYQREVWSRPDVRGYDELVDMTAVEEIEPPSSARVHELASLAARMDAPGTRSKFAIVAPTTLLYGLGRMFEVYRELDSRSTKEVMVFRTREDAAAFLGVEARAAEGGAP